jgi:coenzyme F420-reducing hydrogenase alpha subunit
MEDAAGITLPEMLRSLRRLLYCGEWIESHALHLYLLHAPDFLGYPDAVQMARDLPDTVRRGLELKKAGNGIVALLGGREIHPVNVKVGGFYRTPSKRELRSLRETLLRALDGALETVRWVSSLSFPEFERDYEFVSLRSREGYPLEGGDICSSGGLDLPPRDFESTFVEEQVPHSNALHASIRDRGPYLVGPLARFNIHSHRLTPAARQAALESGIPTPCRNPFMSIIVRAIEIVFAVEEALRLVEHYEEPDHPGVSVEPGSATGCACTEAPRGMLYHRYRLDVDGTIQDARIVPPTSQNLRTIENDLALFVPQFSYLSPEQLTWKCEQAVRNHDPCISCATHSLKLDLDRESR